MTTAVHARPRQTHLPPLHSINCEPRERISKSPKGTRMNVAGLLLDHARGTVSATECTASRTGFRSSPMCAMHCSVARPSHARPAAASVTLSGTALMAGPAPAWTAVRVRCQCRLRARREPFRTRAMRTVGPGYEPGHRTKVAWTPVEPGHHDLQWRRQLPCLSCACVRGSPCVSAKQCQQGRENTAQGATSKPHKKQCRKR